jgi:thioesterase domain-containing protein
VRAIARRNVTSIRSVQPVGPYRLAGHSFGGLIALEMAQQLRRADQQVSHLIILDSFPPDPALHPQRPPRPTRERVKETIGVALTGIRGTPGSDQYWRFYRLSEWLHRRYRSRPWPGNTVVVVADSPEREQRARWAPHLCGEWRLVSVSGDHHSMIRDPYVAQTAAVITEALRGG